MAIEFDIYPSPTPPNSDKETTYHAQVANSDTITTDDIAQNIHKRYILIVSDIEAIISEMHDEMIHHLCRGNHVYLGRHRLFSPHAFSSVQHHPHLHVPTTHRYQGGGFPCQHLTEKRAGRKD